MILIRIDERTVFGKVWVIEIIEEIGTRLAYFFVTTPPQRSMGSGHEKNARGSLE